MKHVTEEVGHSVWVRQRSGAWACTPSRPGSPPATSVAGGGDGHVSAYLSSLIWGPWTVGLRSGSKVGNRGQVQFGEKLIDQLGYFYRILTPKLRK